MTEIWRKLTNADIRNSIAVVWVTFSIGMLLLLSFHEVPAQNKELLHETIDFIKLQLGVILAYYFVQSKPEKKQDDNNPS
jgi:hypothetical protein